MAGAALSAAVPAAAAVAVTLPRRPKFGSEDSDDLSVC